MPSCRVVAIGGDGLKVCLCGGAEGGIVFILLRLLLITSLIIVCEAILAGFRSLSRRGGVVLDLTNLGGGRHGLCKDKYTAGGVNPKGSDLEVCYRSVRYTPKLVKAGITLLLVLVGLELCGLSSVRPKKVVMFGILPLLLFMGVGLMVRLCGWWREDIRP